VRASYDTDAIRGGALELDRAAGSLSEVGKLLTSFPPGACPRVVEDALDDLSRRGKDMIGDIRDEATELGTGLRKTAESYDDLDSSIARNFGGS
jgi:hypothetical protein